MKTSQEVADKYKEDYPKIWGYLRTKYKMTDCQLVEHMERYFGTLDDWLINLVQ